MHIKKIVLPVFLGLSLSCHGVALEGDYEMSAPRGSVKGAMIGSHAGFLGGIVATFLVDYVPYIGDVVGNGLQLIEDSVEDSFGDDDSAFGIAVAAVSLNTLCCLIGSTLGGYLGSFLSTRKAKEDYKKYQAELAGILEAAGDELVKVPLEEFSTYVEGKDKDVVAERLEKLVYNLSRSVVVVEKIIVESSEKTGEWYELLRLKTKGLFDAISVVLSDLVKKIKMLS